MQKDFMELIYYSKHYLPFRCAADFVEIYQQVDNETVYCEGYGIALDGMHVNNKQKKYETPLLANQKLYIAKHPQAAYSSIYVEKFQSLIIKKFILWSEQYLLMLVEHFKNRISEGRCLTHHNSIKIQVGDILLDLSMAQETVKMSNGLPTLAEEIKLMMLKLHKLAGGRSFLKENIVEMLCVFEMVKKIYFKKV